MSEDTEQPSQADVVIGKWPGETLVEKRKACAESLGYPEEKVRYWQKSGQIPQGEHQHVLDCAHRDRVRLRKSDFVRHLKDPAKTVVAAAAA